MSTARSSLPQPRRDWAVLLDFDGTLIDLAASPAAVTVPADLRAILSGLRDTLGGAVALISGRAIGDLDRLLAPLALPVAGQHGAEIRLCDAPVQRLASTERLAGLLPSIEHFARSRPGILIENKGMTIAVHYRTAPQYREELVRLMENLIPAEDPELETIAGHRVFEMRSRGVDKGTAVRRLMERPPFAGRIPLFVGDDTTDEDGFAAALELGGSAIRVGPSQATVAPHSLDGPVAVRLWLSQVCEALAGPKD
jgi:trehalose 6-phosphate phosphatase